MNQKGRDRLVALKKAKKGLITQRGAAGEISGANVSMTLLPAKLKDPDKPSGLLGPTSFVWFG